tara:strand:+ start:958 stop:2100 length:1143 start_codon:yes stop_codon:yes gene_type:complete
MMNNKFLGLNGFLWFVGVVEDRMDPTHTGRVRVRALGHHTQNKLVLPTADLPWAQCLLPTTSSGISGLGQSPSFLVEGSWVMGYFRDGQKRQEPTVLGSLPGKPSELGKTDKGFYDPNFRLDKDGEPTEISVYPTTTDEPDVNRLAVNNKEKEHSSLTARKASRITGIATADFNTTTAADGSSIAASDGDTFDQTEIPYNAVYPYNHVYESESGHIKEYDDSFVIDEDGVRTNHYRIYERHSSGTSTEIDNAGNQTNIIKSSHYQLISKDKKVYVAGNSDITIDGRHKLYINKNNTVDNHYDIQIGAGASINIQVDSGDVNIHTVQGKINMNAGSDYNLKVAGNMNVSVSGSITETVEGSKTSNTSGAVVHRGSTIDLNP